MPQKTNDGVIRIYKGNVEDDVVIFEVGFDGPKKNFGGFKRDLALLFEAYGCNATDNQVDGRG